MRRVLVLFSLLALLSCKSDPIAQGAAMECGNLDRVLSAFDVYLERNALEAEEGTEGECMATCAALIGCIQDEACLGDTRTDTLGDFHCEMLCGCRAGQKLQIPQCAQLTQAAGYEHTPICDIATVTSSGPVESDGGVDGEVSKRADGLCCQLHCCRTQTCPAQYPGADCRALCDTQICQGQEEACQSCDFSGCACG
ncbi:hypothetical protein KKF91_04890 [Myxococcota bacterium]|nr:hypothetical protein [Myxococcota bacterium]MBU1429883.1 hypothetical protein [Myxococcota bacterium]MBU1897388.1 hypothetical protein [Myxococcota bacterium]